MTSAPASAARTASGTSGAMYMTSSPVSCTRCTHGRKFCSRRAQANDSTGGRASKAVAKPTSSAAKSRKLTPKGFSVATRMAAICSRICVAHGARRTVRSDRHSRRPRDTPEFD